MTGSGKPRVFVYGASGHAKVVIDSLECQDAYQIVFVVDDDPRLKGRNFHGYSVIGGRDDLITAAPREGVTAGVVAIGSNSAREAVAKWLAAHGFTFISVVHPAATIARDVRIGSGSVIMPGAILNSDTSIDEHVIINTGATIDHDCRVFPFAHIAPGCHLCGGVTVGRNSFVGAGVTVIPSRSIGDNVIVGAGSTVIHDLRDGVMAMGTPAACVVEK